MTGSKAAQKVSGWPCIPTNLSSCNSPFTCMNLQLSGTVNDLKANYTYTFTSSSPPFIPAAFSMSGVIDVNGVGYTGVCASAPPNKLIQGQNYAGSPVCSTHSDCKYQVYNSSVLVGGNNVAGGNYMCNNTDGSVCAQAASCHPVSHYCETQPQQYPYYNSACATCTGCGTSPTLCGTNYITCLKGGQNIAACSNPSNLSSCCT
jgi:hypothetical protein